MEFSSFLYISNLIGVIAFAASGVFKGIKHDNDIFGVTLLAIVTAVGGGITRDIMLNIIPNAIINPSDIYLAIITALVIYLPYLFFKKKIKDLMTKREFVETSKTLVLICDAIGLAIFIYIGADKALSLNLNAIAVVIMATVTAVGGGVIRDILANETPFILKEDIYAVLCVAGGYLYYYFIINLKFKEIETTLFIFSFVLLIRLIVIFKKLNLPK